MYVHIRKRNVYKKTCIYEKMCIYKKEKKMCIRKEKCAVRQRCNSQRCSAVFNTLFTVQSSTDEWFMERNSSSYIQPLLSGLCYIGLMAATRRGSVQGELVV